MRKPSALLAWRMLILSLPKGIAAFVIVVAGLSVSLPLSIFLLGVPLLAATLVLSRTMMVDETKTVISWLQGKEYPVETAHAGTDAGQRQGWRSWLVSVMKDGRSYRGILFGLLQLPIGVAAFTFAIVLPVTVLAVLLSPAAYEVSMRLFEFDLFAHSWWLDKLLNLDLTSAQRSWIAGGVGLVFALLLPMLFRGLGRLYGAWILSIAGPEPKPKAMPQAPYDGSKYPFGTDIADGGTFQTAGHHAAPLA
ncbi:sensor domain-containing protein [Paenibacillus sp. strain BS8-2]